ncbi:hypothetical protein DL93DRAFT_2078857 [Clavulina sp. PMI_390]|nr:hypothetical protein DL93DRAFT_2078857 [Clavulina sp. PMI_390]
MDLWDEKPSPESSTEELAEPEPLHLVPCLTTPTPSPPNRAFFMPARFAMANTLREFSDIMDDDEFFSLAEFRTECFDPAVEKVLDALRDGMGSDDEAQQDATTWLRFMRQSMQAIEEECSERDPVLNALGIRTLTMSSLSRKARDAFVSDDFGRLR